MPEHLKFIVSEESLFVMVYDIEWLVPERVIYVQVVGIVEISHIVEINALIIEMAQQVTHSPVHVVIDTQELEELAIKVRDVTRIVDNNKSQLFGWIIIITENRFVTFVTAVFAKLTKGRFIAVSTSDQAHVLLQQQLDDIELPPLLN